MAQAILLKHRPKYLIIALHCVGLFCAFQYPEKTTVADVKTNIKQLSVYNDRLQVIYSHLPKDRSEFAGTIQKIDSAIQILKEARNISSLITIPCKEKALLYINIVLFQSAYKQFALSHQLKDFMSLPRDFKERMEEYLFDKSAKEFIVLGSKEASSVSDNYLEGKLCLVAAADMNKKNRYIDFPETFDFYEKIIGYYQKALLCFKKTKLSDKVLKREYLEIYSGLADSYYQHKNNYSVIGIIRFLKEDSMIASIYKKDAVESKDFEKAKMFSLKASKVKSMILEEEAKKSLITKNAGFSFKAYMIVKEKICLIASIS